MSTERNIDTARIFYEAWNDPDPERGAAVIADDHQFVDVPRSQRLIGPHGYRRDYYRWRTAFPDGRVEIVNVIAAGDDVLVEFINRGTNTGPISTAQGDFPATNRCIEVSYCSVMRIEDGKVVSGRDYYHLYTILWQLDLII